MVKVYWSEGEQKTGSNLYEGMLQNSFDQERNDSEPWNMDIHSAVRTT